MQPFLPDDARRRPNPKVIHRLLTPSGQTICLTLKRTQPLKIARPLTVRARIRPGMPSRSTSIMPVRRDPAEFWNAAGRLI